MGLSAGRRITIVVASRSQADVELVWSRRPAPVSGGTEGHCGLCTHRLVSVDARGGWASLRRMPDPLLGSGSVEGHGA